MPTFSAVVPSYNRARLLPETLNSLLAQKHAFDQIIIVDDGSTDDTAAMVAARYPECIFLSQKNGRQQRARNTGIAAATSDWVVLCDSDDLLTPDYLSQIVILLEDVPDLEVINCNRTKFGRDDSPREDIFSLAPPDLWAGLGETSTAYVGGGPEFSARLARNRSILFWPTGLAVRRDFFGVVGLFDERMAPYIAEDVEFTLRSIADAKAGFLKAPVAQIREHGQNFSRVPPRQALKDHVAVLEFCLQNHAHAQRDPLRQAILARLERDRRNILYSAFRDADWQEVRRIAKDLSGCSLTAKERLKIAIARLPNFLSNRLRDASISS